MFETLQRLYTEGKLTETGLTNAILKGWIIQEQADDIKNTAQSGT